MKAKGYTTSYAFRVLGVLHEIDRIINAEGKLVRVTIWKHANPTIKRVATFTLKKK